MKGYSKKGFTLIELLFAVSMLIVITPFVYNFLIDFSKKIYLNDIKVKSLTNTMVVNSTVSGIIGNSYGIDYSTLDVWSNLDTISLYTDKLEQNSISIYVKQELEKDISRLYISKWGIEYPLHSTDLFIEKFNIDTSPQPVWNFIDIQPWASLNISGRTRSPLEEPTEDQYYDMYNKSEMTLYSGKRLIRNYVPSSWKN